MTKIPKLQGLLFFLFLSAISYVQAAGFAIIEQSASGMGNAFAGGAAGAEDGSTIFFNPAGMMLLDTHMVAAGHMIVPSAGFSNRGTVDGFNNSIGGGTGDAGQVKLVPNFYAVYPMSPDVTVGLGIYAPFGLATKYDENWVGRYHAVESDMQSLNFNPSLAYKAGDNLYLGAGVDFQLTQVTLSNKVDFGAVCVGAIAGQLGVDVGVALANCAAAGMTPQQDDGFVELKGDSNKKIGFGWNAGLIYRLNDRFRLGVHYRSEVKQDLQGEADFIVPPDAQDFFVTQRGIFVDSAIKASVTLPSSFSASFFHEFNDDLAIMGDITWTGWDVFDELRVKFKNRAQPDAFTLEEWENSLRYSLGLNYRLDPKWRLRTGLAFDETPIPSAERRTPRVPGADRLWLSFGASFEMNKAFSLDIGYSHLFVSDADINNTYDSQIPTVQARLVGAYDASVEILSAQLRWLF